MPIQHSHLLRGRTDGDGRPPRVGWTLRRVTATESLGLLDGSSQARLVRADDGRIYAVKLTTNPFGPRVAANELIAAELARRIGLATPPTALMSVGPEFGAPPGVHFASQFVAACGSHLWFPEGAWERVENPGDIVGAYVFDAWVGNLDRRQVIFQRIRDRKPYRLLLIDNGQCFGGRAWAFHSFGVPRPAQLRFAYVGVRSWQDLEPWLTNVECLPKERIEGAVAFVPREWLAAEDRRALPWLVAQLAERRSRIRAIIARVVMGGDHPFLRWRLGAERPPAGRTGGGFSAAA